MTIFEYICEHQPMVSGMVKAGIIPVDIHHKIKVYRCYLEHRQSCKRMQAIENVSIDMKQCTSTIYKIVERMEQTV
jgi:hypothetical protein